MVEEIHIYFRDKLDYPAESKDTDYKAATKFDEKTDFTAKLVKHILGFANSGGGYLIIGFREKNDKSLEPDPALTDEIRGSFEVTRLCQHIETYLVGQDRIKIEIYKEPSSSGIIYPIISVGRFPEYPFSCTKDFRSDSTGELILESGLIYIRTEGARTLHVKAPTEWRQLIRECIKASKEVEAKKPIKLETPKKKKKGIKLVTRGAQEKFEDWVIEENDNALKILKENKLSEGYYRYIVQVPHGLNAIDSTSLLKIAEKSECRNTGWPIGVILTKPEDRPIPLNNGIRAVIKGIKNIINGTEEIDYWALNNFGHFFFIRTFEEDSEGNSEQRNKIFWFDAVIWRISEIITYASNLCTELNLKQTEKINLSILYEGLKGRTLAISNPRRVPFMHARESHVNKYEQDVEIEVGNLVPKLKDNTYSIVRGLTGLFDFYKPEKQIVDNIINEFLNSRI
jgi:hypothetical protein